MSVTESITAPTRAIIYARVSTQDQADTGSSLDTQLAHARALAAERGWVLVGEEREDFSGAYLERPGLNRVREQVRAGLVDVLLVHALDRLSRDQLHPSIVFDELRRHHASLHSVTEGSIATAEDLIKLALYAYVAAKEREKIRERTMRGRAEKARQGRLTVGGRELYGTRYLKGEGRRVINEATAGVVHDIFRWVAEEGLTQYAVARRLTDRGIPNPSGKAFWHQSTIGNILRNPAYKGEAYQNKTRLVPVTKRRKPERVGGRQGARPTEEWMRVPGDVTPRLVSDDLWERANAMVRHHARFSTRNARRQYLLTGRITCAECGSHYQGYYVTDGGKEYRYYRCGSSTGHRMKRGTCSARPLRLADADRAVWDYVVSVVNTPRLIIAEMEAQRAAQGERPVLADLARVRERIAALDRMERTLLDLALASGAAVATAVFVEKQRAIHTEREGWRAEEKRLAAVARVEEQRVITEATIANVEAYCARIGTDLANASFEQKRLVLEALNVAVSVDTGGGRKTLTVRGWIPAAEFVVENSYRWSTG